MEDTDIVQRYIILVKISKVDAYCYLQIVRLYIHIK